MSKQPSWEAIAHRLASRVFVDQCPHTFGLDPDCPFCEDFRVLKMYREKCRATGRRYVGQEVDEAIAAAAVVPVHDLPYTD